VTEVVALEVVAAASFPSRAHQKKYVFFFLLIRCWESRGKFLLWN
jgi:hypothetical protein